MAIKSQNVKKIAPTKVAEEVDEQEDAEDEIEEVSVQSLKAPEEVQILVLRRIQPAPTIGTCNLNDFLGVTALEKDQRYRVPRHVAFTLQDAGAAAVLV